ncbi:MAG: phosphoribosylformylglycinamidine synthase subunit PurS [Pirellulaceae bacterium]
MTLWEIDIYPGPEQPDLLAGSILSDAEDLGLDRPLSVATARGYLIEGDLSAEQADQLAEQLLADSVVERTVVAEVGDERLSTPPNGRPCLIHVMPKPGVMDPVAQSALRAIQDFSLPAEAVRTFRKYWLSELDDREVSLLCEKILANDSIEQVVVGSLELDQLQVGSPYEFQLETVALRALDDEGLERLSREGQLYLTLVEMQTIQQHFDSLQRDPVDVELETVAQTWSEHCSHKTLAGRIAYRDERGERQFENMLKETIFAATMEIRQQLGDQDWCVSVFEDNAGIIRFDEENNVVFKVETHNHPSALEPYGGANTGIGGVIRDPMGTGLGAKPICNTDVFC